MDGLSEKLASACGVRAYGGYNLGWCQISTNKGPINTPNDLFNQKIRTMSSDLQMAIVNSTGAGATIVNYGELFTACQQGTVDGMMTSTGLYVSDRFYECQKYMGVEIYLDGVRQYEKDFEAEALQNLAELGMEIREYTDEELQAFKDATSVVYTDYADVAGQETIDTVKSMLGK